MTYFQLDQVLPHPLQEQVQAHSQVWNCQAQLRQGQFTFVSAASGKGKTTLQHILYGLRKDFNGKISINSPEVKGEVLQLSHAQWAKLRQNQLSIVFQDLRLFGHLTGWENLLLKNQLTGFKTEAQIKAMCERLGMMQALLDKPSELLSYGQRQRLAIVRALCQPFALLLMDEPFSHLDQENIQKACALIEEETKAQGAGLVLASLGERYFLNYDQTLDL